MKTVLLKISTFFLVSAALLTNVTAAGFVSLDADARYTNTDFKEDLFALKTFGVVARQVVSDGTSDRWILYGQLEVVDDFSTTDIHQMYAMFKGPMGKWNVTAGRLRLPYGLLPGYSTDHVPFAALDHYTIGVESDNGVAVSGIAGVFDYAIAVTQGSGIFSGFPEQGLCTGRLGIPFGESGEYAIGISGAAGRSTASHLGETIFKRMKLGALDFSGSLGRTSFRSEFSTGLQDDDVQIAGFAGADFSVTSWLEANTAISLVRQAGEYHHAWGFLGTTLTTNYLMIKGGYKYVYHGPIDHQITLMAYKQFAFNF